MKTLITSIFMLVFVTCFSQKSSFKLLENQMFTPLENPDTVYTMTTVNRVNNVPVINLGFKIPVIGAEEVLLYGDGFKAALGGISLQTSLYDFLNLPDDSCGYLSYNDYSEIKVKKSEASGEKSTIIEMHNLSFAKHRQYQISYQMEFNSNGTIIFRYGPNNVQEEFPGYNDLHFSWTVRESWEEVEWLLVSGDKSNPDLFDHYDDIAMINNLQPYNGVPQDFAFSMNASKIYTTIQESVMAEPFWNLNQGKLNILPCNRDREGLISVYASNGALLLTEEISNSGKSIDLNAFKGQLLLVNYACDGKELQSEKFLIK